MFKESEDVQVVTEGDVDRFSISLCCVVINISINSTLLGCMCWSCYIFRMSVCRRHSSGIYAITCLIINVASTVLRFFLKSFV